MERKAVRINRRCDCRAERAELLDCNYKKTLIRLKKCNKAAMQYCKLVSLGADSESDYAVQGAS